MLRDWLDRAVPALEAARERIDAVNVFPVPDGDTGTNVLLTVRGAADEVAALPGGAGSTTGAVAGATPGTTQDADGAAVLRALARGALLSARGNSGVILSRYLGGLAAAASGALAPALATAAEAARSAVPEPEDGTVLTVAAVVAGAASEAAARGAGDADVLDAGVAAGRADLARISAAHPVLRSARVVDAGACALLVLLDALAGALAGRPGPVDVGWLDEHGAAGDPHGAWADDGTDAGTGADSGTGTGAGADSGTDAGTGADAGAGTDAGADSGADSGPPGGYEVVALLRTPADGAPGEGPGSDDAPAERLARHLAEALPAVGDAVAVVAGDGLVTAHVHAAAPADVAEVLTAAGARWTASVRTLLGVERPVVACTGSGEVAAVLADAGALAVLLPDGTPADEGRDAVRRAAQDAQMPVHAGTDAPDDARAGDLAGTRGDAGTDDDAGAGAGDDAGADHAATAGGEPTPAAAGDRAVTVLPGDRLDAAHLDPRWVVPDGATDDAGVLAALTALAVPVPPAGPARVARPPADPAAPATPTTPTEVRP